MPPRTRVWQITESETVPLPGAFGHITRSFLTLPFFRIYAPWETGIDGRGRVPKLAA